MAKSSSSSVPVYPDDVVFVIAVPGFWYNLLTAGYTQQTSHRVEDGDAETQLVIYYLEHTGILEETYAQSSSPKVFSYPQVLEINSSHQNYLLEGSHIEFNFSVKNP